MIVTADASFLVSLYGVDVNTPAARAWMATHAEPLLLTGALRFETENALRLACFRGLITNAELAQAWHTQRDGHFASCLFAFGTRFHHGLAAFPQGETFG